MKKKLTALVILAALTLSLTGCGNKSVIHISLGDLDDYEVVKFPSNVVNYSTTDGVITITVKDDGNYDFVVRDDDDREYSFTVKYKDKKAEAQTDDDIAVNLGIE